MAESLVRTIPTPIRGTALMSVIRHRQHTPTLRHVPQRGGGARLRAGFGAAGALSVFPGRFAAAENGIRAFSAKFPEEALVDLRRRIEATHWPDRETVRDDSQGVPLATIQQLARYWARDYDWRKCEARLNALPQFVTNIDGLDIHFIHVRSKHDNALPLIVTHGWPGSVIEQLKIIDPLTEPTGARRRCA